MGPLGVIVLAPSFEDGAGMRQRAEQGLVQQLVAQTTVKALDEGVLLLRYRSRPLAWQTSGTTNAARRARVPRRECLRQQRIIEQHSVRLSPDFRHQRGC